MKQATAQVTKSAPSKGEQSGDRLLEIAAALFRKQGYASTSMRDIAQAAGMKAGSLYYHFDAKDQILDKVLERGIDEAIRGFKAALAALADGAPFADRLRAVVTAHLRTVAEFGAFTVASRQLLNQVPDAIARKHNTMRLEYDGMWHDLFKKGVARGEIKKEVDLGIVRLFLLGSLNWTSEWVDTRRKTSEQLGKIATEFFLNGLTDKS